VTRIKPTAIASTVSRRKLLQAGAATLGAAAFLSRWNAATNAVVFIPPAILDTWRSRGLQGRVIGGDNQTLVVSRL